MEKSKAGIVLSLVVTASQMLGCAVVKGMGEGAAVGAAHGGLVVCKGGNIPLKIICAGVGGTAGAFVGAMGGVQKKPELQTPTNNELTEGQKAYIKPFTKIKIASPTQAVRPTTKINYCHEQVANAQSWDMKNSRALNCSIK